VTPVPVPYTYAATIVGVLRSYIVADVDLGFGFWSRQRLFQTVGGPGPDVGQRVLLRSIKPGPRARVFKAQLSPLTAASPLYVYNATTRRVTDADTLVLAPDLGFGAWLEPSTRPDAALRSFRLLGCNTRELGQPGGAEAAAAVAEKLPPGGSTIIRSLRSDKYGGRMDAQVTLPSGRDLTAELIAEGWAAPWDGKGPKPVPTWPRSVPNTPGR
jgi:endonuclease YncB( thermonuclease family)